uniref:Rho-related GTP-binding protein RhoQ n=1 Tax=Steinernema glaseri TaxID=37863 RepID=A0A1I7Y6N9_9BILA
MPPLFSPFHQRFVTYSVGLPSCPLIPPSLSSRDALPDSRANCAPRTRGKRDRKRTVARRDVTHAPCDSRRSVAGWTLRGAESPRTATLPPDAEEKKMNEKRLKLVVVGDSYVGKTSLLFAYTEKSFNDTYNTTALESFAMSVEIEGLHYTVNLFDTAGQHDLTHLRSLSYPNTDAFLLCFSLADPRSLQSCKTYWIPEIRQFAGDDVPVILVGLKEDLHEKSDGPQERVRLKKARKLAREIGAFSFFACSALTHRGLKRVFDEALLAAIGIPPELEESSSGLGLCGCCAIG